MGFGYGYYSLVAHTIDPIADKWCRGFMSPIWLYIFITVTHEIILLIDKYGLRADMGFEMAYGIDF